MMIDHHDVGLLRLPARPHYKAILIKLTFRTHAGVAGRGHQIPYQRVFGHPGQLGFVTGAGGFQEARNLAQVADIVARSQPAVLQGALKKYQAKYQQDPEAAKKLISVGESPVNENLNPSELAAYTMVASLLLNLDETLNKN